jgi:hypothetical protein
MLISITGNSSFKWRHLVDVEVRNEVDPLLLLPSLRFPDLHWLERHLFGLLLNLFKGLDLSFDLLLLSFALKLGLLALDLGHVGLGHGDQEGASGLRALHLRLID